MNKPRPICWLVEDNHTQEVKHETSQEIILTEKALRIAYKVLRHVAYMSDVAHEHLNVTPTHPDTVVGYYSHKFRIDLLRDEVTWLKVVVEHLWEVIGELPDGRKEQYPLWINPS